MFLAVAAALLFFPARASSGGADELRVLFLGDSAGHRPAERFKQLEPVFRAKHIDMTYTESLDDLNPAKLAGYDCLAIFANHTATNCALFQYSFGKLRAV